MDLGRVVSFASNREVELAYVSSSGRGVVQKGVSPVWLGRLKVTPLTKPGARTDLEAGSLPKSPEEAPSSAMAPPCCSVFTQGLRGAAVSSSLPADSQLPSWKGCYRIPRMCLELRKKNSQNSFYKYFRAGVGRNSLLGPQLA